MPKKKTCFDILMGVGQRFYPTPKDFINEAKNLGVSKRIPTIPRFFCFGRSKVWLVHWRTREIFAYFIPMKLEIIGANEELLKLSKKYEANVEEIPPEQAAAEPARGCGYRSVGGGYAVAYNDTETLERVLEDAKKQGLLNGKDIFLAGPLVVLKRKIKYTGKFTRGYRYIRVDPIKGTYKILKIKVRKTKKRALCTDIKSYICDKNE